MTRRGAISWLTGAAGVVLSGCGLWRPSEELRYRLTIVVDTPEGERRGSSVIAVRGVKNPDWANIEGRGTRASYRGEAAAVDLPDGRTLFSLLQTAGGASDAADYPFLAFADRLKDSPDLLESMRRLRSWNGQEASMPRTERVIVHGGQDVSARPMLVTFGDRRIPASVRGIDPDNLSGTFGPGTSLKEIMVSMTEEAVTSSIDARLSWLDGYVGSLVTQAPGEAIGNLLPEQRLNSLAFSSGIHK